MKWTDRISYYLRRKIKYTASDPENFEVLWTFRAERVQLLSLLLILLVMVSLLSGIFVVKGPLASYFTKNDMSIERSTLEEQHQRIKELNSRLKEQERYLLTLQRILRGETVEDSSDINVPEAVASVEGLESEATDAEEQISEKVKDDLRTVNKGSVKKRTQFFAAPVKGTVSRSFAGMDHPGTDIVTEKNRSVLSCLAGTVIYSGYTQKDGYILIVEHANGYLSVYKHLKAVLKRIGDKVQMNDPLAIVGNTGENTSGPHLHLELWQDQIALDPEKYMDFRN